MKDDPGSANISRAWFLAALVVPMMAWPATISGLVLGAAPGTIGTMGVDGAKVVLINGAGSSATVVDSAYTNAEGGFDFYDVTTGFKQIIVSADGYVQSPNIAVLGVNSDTATVSPIITITSTGSANVPGTSAIGGLVTYQGASSVEGIMVTLRRRATATSAWVPVDSMLTDENGVFLFSEILAAGTGTTANAYSLVVNDPAYAAFTSGNLTVADGGTTVATISLSDPAAVRRLAEATKMRFLNVGDRLEVELGISKEPRTISVFALDGTLRQRVSVPSGESKAWVPASFSPRKGFVFRVN